MMSQPWMQPLPVGLSALIAACLISFLGYPVLMRAVRREAETAKRQLSAPNVAYAHIAQRWFRTRWRLALWRIAALMVLFTPCIVTAVTGHANQEVLNWQPGAFVCIFAGLTYIPLSLERLLWSSGPAVLAQRLLMNIPISASGVLSHRLKWVTLAYLPPLLAGEAIGAFALMGWWQWIWIITGAALLWVLLRATAAQHVQAWLRRSVPIERTRWAALAPRIHEWAIRFDVKLSDIHIYEGSDEGEARAGIYGSGRRRLFVSEPFLSNSEWRQQDAAFAGGFAFVRSGYTARGALIGVLWLPLGAALTTACVVCWPSAGINVLDPFSYFAVGLAVGIGYGVYVLAPHLLTRLVMRRCERTAHNAAVTFCGDPLAIAVAGQTINRLMIALYFLRAPSPGWRMPSLRSKKETEYHIAQMLTAPGPRAPWADQPVPSRFPCAFQGHVLTTALEEAPSPMPVPREPYPVREANLDTLDAVPSVAQPPHA